MRSLCSRINFVMCTATPLSSSTIDTHLPVQILCPTRAMAHLEYVTLIVHDYDPAIRFFVDPLQFDLVEDVPSFTNDGRPKRWVVVRPHNSMTGILLARADGAEQMAAAGQKAAGRVGFFLRVDDFAATHARLLAADVAFLTTPRVEPYGMIAVFRDLEGNRWDLLGPPADT